MIRPARRILVNVSVAALSLLSCACRSNLPALSAAVPPAQSGAAVIVYPSADTFETPVIQRVRQSIGHDNALEMVVSEYNRNIDPEIPFLQSAISDSQMYVVIAKNYIQIDNDMYDLRCVISKSTGVLYVASTYPKPDRDLVWPPAPSDDAARSIREVDDELWSDFASLDSTHSLREVLESMSFINAHGNASGFRELVVYCVRASGGGVGTKEVAWSIDRRGLTALVRSSAVHGFAVPDMASPRCELLGYQNGRNHVRTLVRDRDLKQGYTSNTPDPVEPPDCVAYWKSITSDTNRD
jgi:hypothetical protein